ncbi:uracil-xanthine permease family protein [Halorussus salinisoli]|uniref:uracil-xanthine permease family protein n=1 Tax=Halorussus salinisoli TaxID=2558242 RepID=UPI0010C18E1E|nr:nucleobase:cation symporter-2 family protein [Halorussus salinisoli]
MADSDSSVDIVYGIDDEPPMRESIPLGLQHILAMILPNIAPPLIIAGAVGLATGQTTFLVQMALLFAGIATIVQAMPIGPVGARLPIVMGTSFAFVGAIIGVATQYSLSAAFGACVVAAVVEIFIGWKFEWFEEYFTPLVNGLIVVIIGLYLIPVGMDYLAGGVDASNYGAPVNLAVGGLVFVIAIGLNQLFDGYLRVLSLLIGIVAGYVAAAALGIVDFSPIAEAAWFAYPTPLKFGIAFEPVPILILGVIYVTTSMETIGHISAITAVEDRKPEESELKGGLLADGVMSGVAGLFGAFPNTSFAQNVGVVTFTGIMSRIVVAVGGGILVLLGFVPKVSAVFSTMPNPVLGGATLVMFGMVLSNGFKILNDNVNLNQRNMVIIAASIGLGLGVATRPEILQQLPEQAQTFFGEAVVVTALVSLILDNVIPKSPDEVDESTTTELGPKATVDNDD